MINITTRKIGGDVIATLIRDDNATMAIRFNVPERTDGVDLSGLSWAVLIRNAAGGTDVYVPAKAERDGHFITFDWFPGGVATAAAGLTEVTISGTAQADNPPVWQSATYYVRVDEKVDADPAGDDAQKLTELQQLIVFVSGELNGVIDAGRSAREAANRANEAAERAESIAGVAVDETLKRPGAAADAAVVGGKFDKLSEEIVDLKESEIITQTDAVIVFDTREGNGVEVHTSASDPGALIHQGKNFCPGGRNSNPNFKGSGVTITPNEDGTIKIVGTTVDPVYYFFARKSYDVNMTLPAGQYVQSIKLVEGSIPDNKITLVSEKELEDGTSVQNSLPLTSLAVGKSTFTLTEPSGLRSFLILSTGTTFDGTISVQYELGNVPSDYEPFVRTQHDMPASIGALDGINVLYTTNGDMITAQYRKARNYVCEVCEFDAYAWGLPVIEFTGKTNTMTKDDAVDLAYKYGNLSGKASVKWQGNSSLSYPKKNYTVKFDQAFEAKDGWGAQKKYCLKANWIDPSHARNIVSAQLWGSAYSRIAPEDTYLAACPNYGAIDGFPCIVMLNGKFHGLYTWNIPKDGWMLNFPNEGATQECILCANGKAHNSAEGFKALETAFGNGFDLEYITDEDVTGWALTSLNNLIAACMATDGTDLDTTIATMLDWKSAVTYLAYTIALGNYDGIIRNYLLYTRDGSKWHFGPYDLDCLFGNWMNGTKVISAGYLNIPEIVAQHRLFELIVTHKKEELKTIYKTLRNYELSEDTVATTFANSIGAIHNEVFSKEQKTWPGIKMTSVSNLAQITDWYRRRVALADKWIDSL